MFRDVSVTDHGHKILRRHHQMASHGTVYDMALDPEMEFVVTVGQVTCIKSCTDIIILWWVCSLRFPLSI